MSDEIRVNRPQVVPRPQSEETGAPASLARSSKGPWIILAVVVLVVIILGLLFRDKLFGSNSGGDAVVTKNPSGYQAVFLTNGQVYFGTVSDPANIFVTLNDIFYLQVVQPPLQGTLPEDQAVPAEQQPQISLVKLGNELHGPVDEMHINRDQILFYEDLKEDGQVVQAIKAYKANPQGGQQVQ